MAEHTVGGPADVEFNKFLEKHGDKFRTITERNLLWKIYQETIDAKKEVLARVAMVSFEDVIIWGDELDYPAIPRAELLKQVRTDTPAIFTLLTELQALRKESLPIFLPSPNPRVLKPPFLHWLHERPLVGFYIALFSVLLAAFSFFLSLSK